MSKQDAAREILDQIGVMLDRAQGADLAGVRHWLLRAQAEAAEIVKSEGEDAARPQDRDGPARV